MSGDYKRRLNLNWSQIVLSLLALALIGVLVWFAMDLKNLYSSGVIRPVFSRIRRRSVVRPTLQPQQIAGWMTFRYVNYVFRLPASYLSTKLNIGNSGYPNITLDQYSKSNKLNQAAFVESVKQALTAYISAP